MHISLDHQQSTAEAPRRRSPCQDGSWPTVKRLAAVLPLAASLLGCGGGGDTSVAVVAGAPAAVVVPVHAAEHECAGPKHDVEHDYGPPQQVIEFIPTPGYLSESWYYYNQGVAFTFTWDVYGQCTVTAQRI